MTDWERAITFVLAREGGYVNDPNDPGGETNMGITKRDFPHEDIKNLTREHVIDLYQSKYWASYGDQKSYCDHLPWPLNMVHFDCTVNIGNRYLQEGVPIWTGRANTILQRALKVTDDGLIGPQTLLAAKKSGFDEVVRAINERRSYYRQLCFQPRFMKYENGWLKRCDQLENAIRSS